MEIVIKCGGDLAVSMTLHHSLHHTATHCNSLQLTATTHSSIDNNTHSQSPSLTAKHCNSLQQHTAALTKITLSHSLHHSLQHKTTHCNSTQQQSPSHSITIFITLQYTATHCNNTQQQSPSHSSTVSTTHCNTLQLTATAHSSSFVTLHRNIHHARVQDFSFPHNSPIFPQKNSIFPQKSPKFSHSITVLIMRTCGSFHETFVKVSFDDFKSLLTMYRSLLTCVHICFMRHGSMANRGLFGGNTGLI